ncbi:putative uncharacterized protein [Clostridium sp. CAG:594]|nr:putative uncharacterized protein [Clostridium sp. CAG:594]
MMIINNTYKKHVIKWLNEKKSYVKESTYANYSYIVYNYIIPYVGNYNVKKLNKKVFQDLILNLHEKSLSNKTIKDIIMVIKSSLRKVFEENKIKSFSLKLVYPKEKNIKTMNVLSKNEQHILMEYIIKNISDKNVGILLSLLCGLRIGEVCALKWENIDLENKIIHITKTIQRIYIKENNTILSKVVITNPKTIKSNRDIPINDFMYEKLINLRKNNNVFVLSGNAQYIEPRTYRNYFTKILKSLNLRHFKYHSLRHTFASNLISLKIDYKTVSELLGHSNISLTLNLYVHPSNQDKLECIDILTKNIMYK